ALPAELCPHEKIEKEIFIPLTSVRVDSDLPPGRVLATLPKEAVSQLIDCYPWLKGPEAGPRPASGLLLVFHSIATQPHRGKVSLQGERVSINIIQYSII
ncbi:MAG: hypothetical protein ACPL5I_06435, partial [Thermodesulfobacteriota bacterium]